MTSLIGIDLPNRACEGKIQHSTRAAARAHAANLRQNSRRHRGGRSVQIYKCPFGDHFHVGNSRKRK